MAGRGGSAARPGEQAVSREDVSGALARITLGAGRRIGILGGRAAELLVYGETTLKRVPG